jgi:hypothetical protein
MYEYQAEKQRIFTDEGQKMFLKIRDKVHNTIKIAGAIRMDSAIAGNSGTTWEMMACVDRLIELKEIVEVSQDGCAGQYRIFTKYE